MENMQKQWTRFIHETQKSQEVISELSKLYIILHEQVRKTILKCTLDLKYDPSQDCHQHLHTILDLLKRMNDPNDTYLQGVDQLMLNKYQEQLYDLSEQVQKILQTHLQVKSIDVKQLQAIKHVDSKEPYSLKDELKRSDKRRLKSRSGRKYSQPNSQKDGEESVPEQWHNRLMEYKKKYIQKREKLERELQGHIEKRNNQVIFTKKYTGKNLEDYFKLRKDVLDLQIADQFTKKIIQEQEERPKRVESNEAADSFQNKLFPQFKIKTKFMKSHVKENILNALADVKLQLLEEYHLSNLKKLSQGNPDTLITLVPSKKSIPSTTLRSKSQSKSTSNLHQRPKPNMDYRPSRQASLTRYPMAHKTCKPLVYSNGWSEEVEDLHRRSLAQRLYQGKVPNIA